MSPQPDPARVAASGHPPVCDAARYKTGCMCDKCRAFDASLAREERKQPPLRVSVPPSLPYERRPPNAS